jgi:hypothetical protein
MGPRRRRRIRRRDRHHRDVHVHDARQLQRAPARERPGRRHRLDLDPDHRGRRADRVDRHAVPEPHWSVGDQISFSGSAVDGEGNPIPASGLSWALDIRHCSRTDANVCHTHFAQTFPGVASGSFSAPDHDYPSHLELVLTATDSHGLSASKTVALQPQTVKLTVDSDPPGATLSIGADTGAAPFTLTYIRKTSTTVTAPSPQDIGGSSYTFSGWSDGGAISHTIAPPTTDTTYKATFAKVTSQKLAGDVDRGRQLHRRPAVGLRVGRRERADARAVGVAVVAELRRLGHADADGVQHRRRHARLHRVR